MVSSRFATGMTFGWVAGGQSNTRPRRPKLTETRAITAYKWVHPDEER